MQAKRPKFCVFCGRKPVEKNREHVIPQWLIKHTGKPGRPINLGSLHGLYGAETLKTFAFGKLTFPACTTCNRKYGKELEEVARPVILKLLEAEAVSASDIDVLLDWLDKVRIGLWLGHYYYLSGSPYHDTDRPFMYIDSQVGSADRMLCIYEYEPKRSGISFPGIETRAFGRQPYCFSLTINHLAFFTVAFPFLCSRSMGLPYAGAMYAGLSNRADADIYPGTETIEPPVVDFSFDHRGSTFFQAVRPTGISEALPSLYENDYVHKLIAPDTGKGPVVFLSNDQLRPYSSEASKEWMPIPKHDPLSLNCLLATQTLWVQDYTLQRFSYEKLDPDSRTNSERLRDLLSSSNRTMLAQVEENCKEGRFEKVLRAFDAE
jgi:hypothetical protein